MPSDEGVPKQADQLQQVLRHIHVMKSHCAEQGVAIPTATATAIVDAESYLPLLTDAPAAAVDTRFAPALRSVGQALQSAWVAHAKLCELVAPATPLSIEWSTAPASTPAGKQRWAFVWGMVLVTLVALGLCVWLWYTTAWGKIQTSDRGFAGAQVVALKDHPAWTFIQKQSNADSSSPVVVGDFSYENLRSLAVQVSKARAAVSRVYESSHVNDPVRQLANETESSLKDLETAITKRPFPTVEKDRVALAERLEDLADDMANDVADWGVFAQVPSPLPPARPDYLMLLLAGTLGAAFFNLYCSHQYIVNRTFDTAYIQRYLIRLVLGAVAGLVLGHFGSEIIGLYTSNGENKPALELSRAFLALLGGYAVEVVNLMLTRVVEALSTVFRGSFDDVLKSKQAELEAKAEKDKTNLKMSLLKRLTAATSSPGELRSEIDRLIKELGET